MSSKGAGCKRWREGCKFFIWSEQFGKELSEDQIKELIEKKETGIISGFKKKSGEGTNDARLVLSDEFKIRLSFENNAEKEPVPSSVGKKIDEAAPGA